MVVREFKENNCLAFGVPVFKIVQVHVRVYKIKEISLFKSEFNTKFCFLPSLYFLVKMHDFDLIQKKAKI